MAHKKKKENSETRKTWVGLYTRKTKTFAEKKKQADKKAKQKGWNENE